MREVVWSGRSLSLDAWLRRCKGAARRWEEVFLPGGQACNRRDAGCQEAVILPRGQEEAEGEINLVKASEVTVGRSGAGRLFPSSPVGNSGGHGLDT